MKQFVAIFFTIVFCFLITQRSNGQVTVTNNTNTVPNLATTYGSLAEVITALDGVTTINGPVIISLDPGNPETAPAGGYIINFTAVTTAINNVTITGNTNTITASNALTVGSVTDAIFKIIGSDYVTIEHFRMQENGANTATTVASNNMTEWGVALLHASQTNGAQNNTIQNNTITLNRAYSNAMGVYSNTRHSAGNVTLTEEITNNTSGPNKGNKIYTDTISNVNIGIVFIGSGAAANMDIGNDVGGSSTATGNLITNWGGLGPTTAFVSVTGTSAAVFLNHQKDENVSYNTITSATLTGAAIGARGIYKEYGSTVPTGTFTSNITNNLITITNNFTGASAFNGIFSTGISTPLSTATININNNQLLNLSVGVSSTMSIAGISNTSQVGVLNMNNNIIRGTTYVASTTGFTGLSNSGAVQTTLNINNNQLGNASGNAVTFTGATSGNIFGISVSSVAAGAAVSISNNNFQGFAQPLGGSGSHTYITLTHAPSTATTDNINDNTFTNITANTSGSVTFINRTGGMISNAGATENCNNNRIITGFSKPIAGGTITLYNTTSTSLSGNTMTETGNDFSNITTTGATGINGWNNIEGSGGASGPTKTINNNIFKNWTGGSGSISVIQSDGGGDNTTISGNDIQNVSGTGFLTVITIGTTSRLKHAVSNNIIATINAGSTLLGITGGSTATSLVNINGNDIHSLTSTGSNQTEAIKITAATIINIGKNKIYDINAQNAAGQVYGIDLATITVSATYNITNNYIGDLKAGITSSVLAIRAINAANVAAFASFNIYYNTVYLNATSSGTDFGTSALYLITNNTATTGAATLRNNIFVNTSTPNGSGITAAYRRNLSNLTNYTAASNNNIFYAGIPSATKLIFYDGTNADQTLAAFKARVTARETNSFTEMPTFLSTSGASAIFLHLDPATPTQAESGAVNITGYTDDYDGNIRQGNAGYSGTGTAPDIGADEIAGIYSEANPPVINYTTIPTPSCTFSGMTITGVTITDATGIPLSGANRPRIYYRKNAGSWFSQPGTNTGGTATNSTWSFTIVESDMGGVAGGNVISYYIIAQDLNPIINVGSNPSAGLVATGVNSVTTHPTSPNTYILRYNLNGTYTVGATGNFSTLTSAVSAYNNACAISGAVIFELLDNTYNSVSETFPITINNHVDASAVNTLTIRPSATAIPLITGNSSASTINLDGAKYIRFDGRQAGAGTNKSLTITSSTTGVAINFVNDAQNNIVRYCSVTGQRVSNFSGTIFFGTASTGTGNDNNTIDNNDISEAGGFSNNGIYSAGTAGKENDNITVSNNNISNYFNATGDSHGIWVSSNSNSWTITGNRFFQTATRVYTTTNINVFGIYVTTGTGYTVSNNIVGYANVAGTGTTNMIGNTVPLAGFPASYTPTGTPSALRYAGIGMSLGLVGPTSTVDGNTVAGIAMYTSSSASTLYGMFGGIYIESGAVNIGTNTANTIGSATGSNSIYVATTSGTGTIVGIRAACIISSSIQNNIIGSITSSGTTAANSGNFTGISVAGTCSYTINNNSVGNANADNIRVGYFTSGANLSNTGTLTATNVGITANVRGITSTSILSLSITNNTLRGWALSCRSANNYGIETSGSMPGGTINVNNNFIGTAATNWINSAVDNNSFFYTINVTNVSATNYNIKNNDIRGTFFGTQNSVGGSFLRLTGASSANAIATISGNTFTNLGMKFSTASMYFIFTSYTLSATGQLIIDNNKTIGSFAGSGTCDYHMVHAAMSSTAGATASITNNDFSNISIGTAASSDLFGIYSSFSVNPCSLTVTGNILNNWTSGPGGLTGIDIEDMTGTATCSGNTISNIATQGDIQAMLIATSGNSGLFNIASNTITTLASTGGAGFINGISLFIPTGANTTQTNLNGNTMSGFSSIDPIALVAGIYLISGNSSSIVSINKNKIYNLLQNGSSGHVYGIYNEPTSSGDITYANNYIGDLRAPNSTVTDVTITGMRLYLNNGQNKVYYNTIHLNATGNTSQFSSTAVYADGATNVVLRNNIFSNTSGHGASGKTVAYWRGDTNLGTYNAVSNNNLFYAGTASAQNLLFYDGTNSDQTLATYQTRVSPRDDLSASAAQNFISTTGSNINFLHIAATGNCSVNARGNNSGISLATDYDNETRSTVSPFVTDIGADEFSKKVVWTGSNGTNWNDTGNWGGGVVPNANDENVVISNPPVNQPVIASGETYQVASVIIGAAANLTNKGTLKVAGSIYTSVIASFNNVQAGIVEGSVEMNGNCSITQPLAGDVFVSNAVKDFKVSNDVKIAAIAAQQLNICGELSFGGTGKTLFTNDNIVLVSTVNKTANVADVTGNTISGKATVERFINTGLVVDGRHLKSWQFLATPTAGQTIFQSWQEGGTAPVGYGTIITGTGSGFDIPTALPSMKFYDNSTNNWTGITNTGNSINDQRGYMLFVRGDRSVTAYNQSAVPTNLRTKGTLYQPSLPPPVSAVQAGKFESVGNPYASAINILYMKNNGLFVNLNNDVTVWDPLLAGTYLYGGYQTLSATNNYEPTAGGTTYYPSGTPVHFIQSGQAFFVHSAGPAGSVTFTEACKESSSRMVYRPAATDPGRQFFRVSLYTADGIIADGNAVAFDRLFNNAVDKDDAYKIINTSENFGLIREGTSLAVEGRMPVQRTDTIFYNMYNLRKQQYQLRFAPKNMQTGLKAYLIDQYLHSTTELSLGDSSFVNIVINDNPLSAASDRFYVVFKQRVSLSDPIPHTPHVNTIGMMGKGTIKTLAENKEAVISIYPNPVVNKVLQLHFENQLAGTYRVELVSKQGQLVYTTTLAISTENSHQSIKVNPAIAAGDYLVNIYAGNGKKTALQVIIK